MDAADYRVYEYVFIIAKYCHSHPTTKTIPLRLILGEESTNDCRTLTLFCNVENNQLASSCCIVLRHIRNKSVIENRKEFYSLVTDACSFVLQGELHIIVGPVRAGKVIICFTF